MLELWLRKLGNPSYLPFKILFISKFIILRTSVYHQGSVASSRIVRAFVEGRKEKLIA
jgi:hypothetical protein